MINERSCGNLHRKEAIGNVAEKSKSGWQARAAAVVASLMVTATFPPYASADDLGLARAKKCLNCHAIDQKLVGPAFKSVAQRYANDKDAEARLALKIRQGGSGSWGVVPMPTNDLTPAEAQQLAHWVLLQK